MVEEFGSKVNQAKSNGNTALICAAQHGCLDIVRFLVDEGGADVNLV